MDRARFFSRVTITPGCWVWQGRPTKAGYGLMQNQYAHRISYRLHHGEPGDLCVLHRCDNRLCVNPDHLFLGTRTDNMEDKVAKGRQLKGEQAPQAKLTEEQVFAIRRDTRTQRVIAADYGIVQSHVSLIKSGKHWRHLEVTA